MQMGLWLPDVGMVGVLVVSMTGGGGQAVSSPSSSGGQATVSHPGPGGASVMPVLCLCRASVAPHLITSSPLSAQPPLASSS